MRKNNKLNIKIDSEFKERLETKAGLYDENGNLKAKVGKRGKDRKPRRTRSDRGLKRRL